MILILVDACLIALLVITCVHLINKFLRAHNQQKIATAKLRQEEAKEASRLIKEINPDEINANEKEVQQTLNKLL